VSAQRNELAVELTIRSLHDRLAQEDLSAVSAVSEAGASHNRQSVVCDPSELCFSAMDCYPHLDFGARLPWMGSDLLLYLDARPDSVNCVSENAEVGISLALLQNDLAPVGTDCPGNDFIQCRKSLFRLCFVAFAHRGAPLDVGKEKRHAPGWQ
jgi:hypothetical protein